MDVGIIVDEPEAVAPFGKAQVEVMVHEMEFHPLGPLYLTPWVHECVVCVNVLNSSRMNHRYVGTP
jgi:hypothetical protein